VEEGRRLAYPTTGSLVLRAKDRLRLFRFPLTRDTLPLLASTPIRVNSTGGILTLLLIRLRGIPPLGINSKAFISESVITKRSISFLKISNYRKALKSGASVGWRSRDRMNCRQWGGVYFLISVSS